MRILRILGLGLGLGIQPSESFENPLVFICIGSLFIHSNWHRDLYSDYLRGLHIYDS